MSEAITHQAGSDLPTATQVFLAWERLRIVYNLALVVVVLGWVMIFGELSLGVLFNLPAGAIGANLCFCAGPVTEGYLCLLGLPRQGTRWVVFASGTLFAGVEAVWELNRLSALGGMGS